LESYKKINRLFDDAPSNKEVLEIKRRNKNGESVAKIKKDMNIHPKFITDIIKKYKWKKLK